MDGKIKVVMCPVDRAPYVTSISGTLENMQKTVGGWIEAVTIATDCVIICNEEGILKSMKFNRAMRGLGVQIFGDAFVCAVDGEEFAGLSEDNARFLLAKVKKAWERE